MRGPGIKLDLDVRRLWTCPVCHKQRRLPGHVASPLCPCSENGVVMQLTADSKLLRRAERITPLPFEKRPGAVKPVIPEPVSEMREPEPSRERAVVADVVRKPEAPARDDEPTILASASGSLPMADESSPVSDSGGELPSPTEPAAADPAPQPDIPPDVEDFASGL